jgi:hypothetical protein
MSILERAGEWILHVLQPAERDRVGAVELKHPVRISQPRFAGR